MKLQLKPLLILAMLAVPALCGEPMSHTQDFGDSRFQDFDFRTLVDMEPRECLRTSGILWTRFHRPERDGPKRPDMAEAMIYWAARNPRLAGYFQEQAESIPVLFENYSDRRFVNRAGRFPAEWSIRFLARLAMDETRMTSNEIDFTNGAEFEEWFIKYSPSDLPADNAYLAMIALHEMNLHGGSPPFVDGEYFRYSDIYITKSRANARAWWAANEHRFPEIAKATWGDRAVLNADIGLGPDNKPLIPTGLAPPGTRPRKTGAVPADGVGTPALASGGPAPIRWIPLSFACGLLALAVAGVIHVRGKRR